MKNLPIENYILIFSNIEYFFMFVGISSGIVILQLFVKMIIYEIEFYNGAGEDFLKFGKDTMMRNYYTRLILRIPMEVKVYPCCLTKYWYEI